MSLVFELILNFSHHNNKHHSNLQILWIMGLIPSCECSVVVSSKHAQRSRRRPGQARPGQPFLMKDLDIFMFPYRTRHRQFQYGIHVPGTTATHRHKEHLQCRKLPQKKNGFDEWRTFVHQIGDLYILHLHKNNHISISQVASLNIYIYNSKVIVPRWEKRIRKRMERKGNLTSLQ